MENVEGLREGEKVHIQSTSGEIMPQSTPPMEDFERALRYYAIHAAGIPPVIRRPTIQENNFVIKPITL